MIPDEIELMWSGGIALGFWIVERGGQGGQTGAAIELLFWRMEFWWNDEPETF